MPLRSSSRPELDSRNVSGDDHKSMASTLTLAQAYKTGRPQATNYATLVAAIFFLVVTVWLHGLQQGLPKDDDAAQGSQHCHLLDNAKAVAIYCVLYSHLLWPIIHPPQWRTREAMTWLKHATPAEGQLVYDLLPPSMPLFCFISGVCSQGSPNHRRVKSFLMTLVLPSILWSYPISGIIEVLTRDPASLASLTMWPGFSAFLLVEWYLPSLIIWRCMAFLLCHHLHPVAWLLLAQVISCVGGYFWFGGMFGVESTLWQITSMGTTVGYLPYFVSGYVCNFKGICKRLPPMGWLVRVAALGVALWLPQSCSIIRDNPTDPHFGYAVTNSLGLGPAWLLWADRVVRWSFDMLSMGLVLFVVLPRSETWFSWMGQHTLYPYLLHHHLFLTQRTRLVSCLPLPVLTSHSAHLAVLFGHAPLVLAAQAAMSSWPVRRVLQPIFKPACLEPFVDRLMGTSK